MLRAVVEQLINKIRDMQRRAYGLRDKEYLRLKLLTGVLPEIDRHDQSLPARLAEDPTRFSENSLDRA
jgi:hypothetical protein